ncbi:DNA translocase FtsK [Sulfuriferula nivalis]|uniref:DNA translocase FtsK n=1 Tax=Sulfuriferula nivalis TaxID=2675298 RepID=A0A809S7Z7_9PROT|nr:DNA translocase FtsK [Sulfuriferula nivalis]BBP00143.1 DNA translocase FtsK [Sulfuriferula nivalis]
MFTPTRKNTAVPRKPLPPKVSGLLREVSWIFSALLAFGLTLTLASYSATDPSWSHSSTAATVNLGGSLGAYVADILYTIFGYSAWWLVIFAGANTYHSYYQLDTQHETDPRSKWIRHFGFITLFLASCSLESARLHSLGTSLPEHAGGIVGTLGGDNITQLLGFTGGTIFLLVMMAVGWSLFTGISWLFVAESIGAKLETGWFNLSEFIANQRIKRAGVTATRQREEIVQEQKQRFEHQDPIIIETPTPTIIKSERVEIEKQVPLFAEMPDTPLPPLHLLDPASPPVESLTADTLEFTSRLIERKLNEFNVQARVVAALPGPVITRYEIEPASGVKGSQVLNLAKDLARALSVVSIRIVETIPGKTTMALEIPNPKREIVRLSEILEAKVYHDMHSPLTMAMGKDIAGNPVVADLAKMPHVLVAGTTGSGKSVAINAMILSLLYKADASQVRLILVDPKMLELSIYDGIPHLLAPVVTDMRQAAAALNWCVAEMERRYKLMSALGVRNIAGYNQKIAEAKKAGTPITHPFSLNPSDPEPLEHLPLIVVVIDELADLMMVVGKSVEQLIARLAQKARAAGVHLILATQRPSVDVITGLIKANVPTRVAFQVSSKIDSRTILDQMGAEALLGQGDMLYMPPGTGYPVRVHGAFVADHEVHKVVDYLKQMGEPNYIEGILDTPEEKEAAGGGENGGGDAEADVLYDEAVALVLRTRRPSISAVQRHLRIGYNRAARLIEAMESAGLVTPMQHNGNREVIGQNRE